MRLSSVLAALGGVAVSFGGGFLVSQHTASTSRAVARQQPSVVTEVRSELASRYVRRLPAGVLDAPTLPLLLRRLHDPYTTYFTPTQFAALRDAVQGEEFGVGLRVAPGAGVLRVLRAEDGSPAARLGVRKGDAIVAIDGVPTQGLRFSEALARLRGVSGTVLSLRIEHGPNRDPLEVHMVRVRLHPDAVSWSDAGGGSERVRVIRIRSFARGVATRVRELIDDRTPVVLDLRGDPGGLLREAADTADIFLTSGPIVSWSGAHLALREISAHPGDEPPVRLVVLVDHDTASAAEVLTAALQDDKRATVVGTRTFGKASVQAIQPLPDGGALKMTIATYRTPLGRNLHGRGVRPDVQGGPDPLQRAIGIARG